MPITTANTALEYFDGFDDYSAAQMNRYWNYASNITLGTSYGRNGTNGVRLDGSISITLGQQATRTIGFAYRQDRLPGNGNIVYLMDTGTNQVCLQIRGDGTWAIINGQGTTIATTTNAIQANIFYYIEFSATIHTSSGSITLKVNGNTWATVSGVRTNGTNNNWSNQVYFTNSISGYGTVISIDDFYSRSDSTFCGDVRVESLLPTSNGNTNAWSRGGTDSGSNWSQVNDNPPNDDTNYIYTGSTGTVDEYVYPNLSTTAGTVYGLMTVPVMRNDAAGNVAVASVYRSGGTDYFSSGQTVGATTYNAYMDIQGQNPATSSAWTVSSVNAAQFGIKRTA